VGEITIGKQLEDKMSALDDLKKKENKTPLDWAVIEHYTEDAAAELAQLRAELTASQEYGDTWQRACQDRMRDIDQLRARNKELEEYHGFYMGVPIPEGEPTIAEEKLKARVAELEAAKEEAKETIVVSPAEGKIIELLSEVVRLLKEIEYQVKRR
jgi:hypothetical protein